MFKKRSLSLSANRHATAKPQLHKFPPLRKRWATPDAPMDDQSVAAPDPAAYQQQLEEGFREGVNQGFAQGMAEGKEEGYQEGMRLGFDDGMRKGLAEGKQQARQLLALVEEAVTSLPQPPEQIRVMLNAEEFRRISEAEPEKTREWGLVADPALELGECRVITDTTEMDVGCQHRLDQCVSVLKDNLLPEAAHEQP